MEEADGSHDSSRIARVSKSQSGNEVDAVILRNQPKEQSFQQYQEAKEVNWWGQAPGDEESDPVVNDCQIANEHLLPDTIEENEQPKVKSTTKFNESSSYVTQQTVRGSHIRRRGIPGKRGRRGRGASSQYRYRSKADIMALAPKPVNTPSTAKSEQDSVPRSDYVELQNKMAEIQKRIEVMKRDLEEKEDELKRKDFELEEKEKIIKDLELKWDNWGGKEFRRGRYEAKGMNAEENNWRKLPEWKKRLLTKQIGDLVISLKGDRRVKVETLDIGGGRRPSPSPSNFSRPKMEDKHIVQQQLERESLMQLDQGAKEREQSNANISPSEIEPRDININELSTEQHQKQSAEAEDLPYTKVPYQDRGNYEPLIDRVPPPISHYPPSGYPRNWQIPPWTYTRYCPQPPATSHSWGNMRYPGVPQNSPLIPNYPYPMDYNIRHRRPLPPQHRLQQRLVPISEANYASRQRDTPVGYPNPLDNRQNPPINPPSTGAPFSTDLRNPR